MKNIEIFPHERGINVITFNAGYNIIIIGTAEECASYIKGNTNFLWKEIDSSRTHCSFFGTYVPRGE